MKYNVHINKEELTQFLETCNENTRIYLGCDSARVKIAGKWFAEYFAVCVVHIDGCKGGRIFYEAFRERDYDQNAKKPRMRLMNEVYKVADLYLRIADVIEQYDLEIHLDINCKEEFASNIVVKEAAGYIQGTCNIIPMIKPNAFAASFAADRIKSLTA